MPSDAALSPAPTGRNNGGGKMQKLLKSAFKRGDSPAQAAGEEPELSPSASRGSGSGSGRTSSGRRVARGDDVGDRSSRESVELDAEGETNCLPSLPSCFAFCTARIRVKVYTAREIAYPAKAPAFFPLISKREMHKTILFSLEFSTGFSWP